MGPMAKSSAPVGDESNRLLMHFASGACQVAPGPEQKVTRGAIVRSLHRRLGWALWQMCSAGSWPSCLEGIQLHLAAPHWQSHLERSS